MTALSRPNIIATCCGFYDDRLSAPQGMATAPSTDIRTSGAGRPSRARSAARYELTL